MDNVRKGIRFSPSLCLTHNCNLNCIYCYQQHDTNNHMSFETACKCIDEIFDRIPDDMDEVEISFIGGEPLIEFELIKQIVDYTKSKKVKHPYIFYATTNGTLLDDGKKQWFREHRNEFVLGLSLDGIPEIHNKNRSNSFEKIDVKFFLETWPEQGIKMTISQYSLENLAENIIFLHSLGVKEINGVNLFEGAFDWSREEYIRILIPELKKLVAYYVEHDDLVVNQMLARHVEFCEEENRQKTKWCGIGTGTVFFDTDGKRYPCPFVTPMTFDDRDLECIQETEFENPDNFIDDDCFNNCYIYPICPHCSGANYLTQKTFKYRDRSKCRIQKLITLYCADFNARRLLKNPTSIPEDRLYHMINAINKIRDLYLSEFSEYEDIL